MVAQELINCCVHIWFENVHKIHAFIWGPIHESSSSNGFDQNTLDVKKWTFLIYSAHKLPCLTSSWDRRMSSDSDRIRTNVLPARNVEFHKWPQYIYHHFNNSSYELSWSSVTGQVGMLMSSGGQLKEHPLEISVFIILIWALSGRGVPLLFSSHLPPSHVLSSAWHPPTQHF